MLDDIRHITDDNFSFRKIALCVQHIPTAADRVGFLPAKTCFCQTGGFKWFKPVKQKYYYKQVSSLS